MNQGTEASPQPESSAVIDILAWFEVNKKRLIYVGAAFLAIAFVAYSWKHVQDRKEAKANEALLSLNVSLTGQTNIPPAKSADLLKVASDFAGTKTAERASFLAATALHTEGKYAEAQAAFDRFQSEYPGSMLIANAAIGSAIALESQGKSNEALTAYAGVYARFPNSGVVSQAKYAAARLQDAKNSYAEAFKLVDELTKMTNYSGWLSDAEKLREALVSKHPELIKPKESAVVSTNPPPAGAPPVASKK